MLSCVAISLSAVAAEEEKLGTVIGIDLGTTYSCVGVYKNGRVEIIANDQVRPACLPDGTCQAAYLLLATDRHHSR